MNSLDEMKLIIPRLWEADFDAALDAAEGAERELIRLQAKMTHQLRPFEGADPKPDALGWLALWSRAFAITEGVLGAISEKAGFSLTILGRALFELDVHVGILLEPIGFKTSSSDAWHQVRQRLVGYVAWAIYYDARFYERMLDPDNLTGVYDPVYARELIGSLGSARPLWEREYGEIPIDSDQEVELDRSKAESQIRNKLEQYRLWMRDPELEQWVQRIEERSGGKRIVPLTAVFEEKETSVWKHLEGRGIEWAYSDYQRSSQIIHGSSLDYFLMGQNDFFAPTFGTLNADAERLAARRRESLARISGMLTIMWKCLFDQANEGGADP